MNAGAGSQGWVRERYLPRIRRVALIMVADTIITASLGCVDALGRRVALVSVRRTPRERTLVGVNYPKAHLEALPTLRPGLGRILSQHLSLYVVEANGLTRQKILPCPRDAHRLDFGQSECVKVVEHKEQDGAYVRGSCNLVILQHGGKLRAGRTGFRWGEEEEGNEKGGQGRERGDNDMHGGGGFRLFRPGGGEMVTLASKKCVMSRNNLFLLGLKYFKQFFDDSAVYATLLCLTYH